MVCCVTLTSCRQQAQQPVNPAEFLKVTDFRGKEIILMKPAERIVCLIESALSGIYMLNAGSRVVGVPSAVYDESVAGYYADLDERIRFRTITVPGNWDFREYRVGCCTSARPGNYLVFAGRSYRIY